MKIYKDLQQGTAEWLRVRGTHISGTDAAEWMLDPKPVGLTVVLIQKELDLLNIAYKKSGEGSKREDLIKLLPGGGANYRELSKSARNLLVGKILAGRQPDKWQLAQAEKEQRQMENLLQIHRGKALEPIARQYYEQRTGRKVTEVGFIGSDDDTWGMSPDGIILKEGTELEIYSDGTYDVESGIERGLELKNLWPDTHARYLLECYYTKAVPGEYQYQCRMGMAVTGCDQWDFLSYCPGQAPLLVTAYRDKETDQLVAGLEVLAEEREIILQELDAMWDLEFTGDNARLLTYPNGQPIYAADGGIFDALGQLIDFQLPTWSGK